MKLLPKSLETLLQKASTQLQSLNLSEAERLYVQALTKRPGLRAAQLGLAMVYNRTQRADQAFTMLRTVWNDIQPPNPPAAASTQAEILAQLGLAKHQQGHLDDALVCYRQAFQLCPSPALQSLIQQATTESTQIHPVQQLLHYAWKELQQGRKVEAARACHAALQLNPDSDAALHLLGDVRRQQGRLDEALPLIQQAIILQPEVAEYHNTLGMLFHQKNEHAKAVRLYQRALKLDSTHAAAQSNLGVALKQQGKFEEAVHAYEKALKLSPDMPEIHNNLGNLQRQLGQFGAARINFERALLLQPGYADAEANLASLLSTAEVTQDSTHVVDIPVSG